MAFVVPTIFSAVDKFTAPVRAMSSTLESFSNTAASSLARGERSFRKFKHGADEAFEKFINVKNAIAGIVIGETTKKIFELAESTSKAGDEAAKTSRRLGLTAESLQELKFAAGREGIDAESFVSGMETMNVAVGKLHAGTGRLLPYLKKVSPEFASQLKHAKTNEQAFNVLSKVIGKLKTPLDKAAVAQLAFGGSGNKMLNLISKGPDGIAALREEARKYGGVMSNEAAEGAENFNDAQENMEFAITGVKNVIGSALMPVIQKLMERLTDWISNNKDLLRTKVAEYAKKFSNVLLFLANHLDAIILTVKIFVGALVLLMVASIASSLAMWGTRAATIAYNAILLTARVGMIAFTAAQWLLNAALTANPIGLVIVAIAALIALVVGVIAKWNQWGAAVSLFLGPLGFVISLIQSFRRNWEMITNAFKTGGILSGLKAIGKTLLDAVLAPLQQILSLVARFTGFQWAADATKNIEKFREKLGVNVDTDESGNPMPGKKLVDNKSAAHKALIEKVEQTNNAKVGLTIDNKTNNKITTSNPNGVQLNYGSTFGFAGK